MNDSNPPDGGPGAYRYEATIGGRSAALFEIRAMSRADAHEAVSVWFQKYRRTFANVAINESAPGSIAWNRKRMRVVTLIACYACRVRGVLPEGDPCGMCNAEGFFKL